MIIVEITMPHGRVMKMKYDDLSVDEAMESFEKLYEYSAQGRLQYVSLPENLDGKKSLMSPEIFKQCIIELYNA